MRLSQAMHNSIAPRLDAGVRMRGEDPSLLFWLAFVLFSVGGRQVGLGRRSPASVMEDSVLSPAHL